MFIAVVVVNLVINLWLSIILLRQGVGKQTPWFVCYVTWGFMSACVALGTWFIHRQLYVTVYWWMEALQVILIVGAVRESFLRIFEGFTSKSGFRWAVWGLIAAVVIYSTWKAIYAPPVHSTRLATFIIGSEFAFRWGIVAIWLLTSMWAWLLQEPTNTREDAVVTGLGVASIAVVANTIIVSLFGTRFLFFSKYLPSVGYFIAAFRWIWLFSRPIQGFGLKDLGMEPEDVGEELRRYRTIGERIMRKN